jgi:hypothetical protein
VCYTHDRCENRTQHYSGKWPTWRTISSIISLFESSTCFEQLCAHPQVDSCINCNPYCPAYRTSTNTEWLYQKLYSYSCPPEFHLDLNTGRPLTQNDYTRCCIHTVVLLRRVARNMYSNSNKHIIEEIVYQVGHLPELYEDALSENIKFRAHYCCWKTLCVTSD